MPVYCCIYVLDLWICGWCSSVVAWRWVWVWVCVCLFGFSVGGLVYSCLIRVLGFGFCLIVMLFRFGLLCVAGFRIYVSCLL